MTELKLRFKKLRKCGACYAVLVKKPKEKENAFRKRQTCNYKCAKELRAMNNRGKTNKCFCGEISLEGQNFCCWEHRLIFLKCKAWGIAPSLDGYEQMKNKLDKEQLDLDKRLNSCIGLTIDRASLYTQIEDLDFIHR